MKKTSFEQNLTPIKGDNSNKGDNPLSGTNTSQ